MGKNKGKGKHKNKDACEFVLVNRGMDDPNYNNPDASQRVLLYVPKDEGEVNLDHEKILNQIPDVSRGLYTEETVEKNLKDLGVNFNKTEEELRRHLDEINKEKFIKKVNIDLGKNEVVDYFKNSKIEPVEEEVDTCLNTDKKKVIIPNKNIKINDIPKDPKQELEDKKVDDLLKAAKISASITEYNKFGLKADIDPEVLQYVTDKAFVEGVDIFIPASGTIEIDHNRFDIDIPPEKMDENYKEVYEAMKSEDEEEAGEELEDDFILLANEGVLPIEIDPKVNEAENKSEPVDEFVITETKTKNNKTPSYKFITKEEQELLDKQFAKTFNDYYKEDNKENKNPVKDKAITKSLMEEAINELTGASKKHGLTSKYVDEDEYEDYEFDEDGDDQADYMEGEEGEFEEYEEEEKEIDGEEEKNKGKDEENKIEYFENNFKVEYVNQKEEKQNKKGKLKKGKGHLENFTVKDLDKLIHDDQFVSKTIELFENNADEQQNDKEEEGIPVFYPKKRINITSVHAKLGNLPKTIGAPSNKASYQPHKINNQLEKSNHDEAVTITANKPLLLDTEGETKEEKKLRKKLLKEEKKEKRKQKKDLKTAFQHEKVKQMKQMANTNQVIRFGLSVRDV